MHIELDHVVLRPITTGDTLDLLRIYSDDRVARYLPIQPKTHEEASKIIDCYLEGWRRDGYGIWSVRERSTERMIGRCGFFTKQNTDQPPVPTHEIAYLFEYDAWGRGIGTECASAALKFGFEMQGFDAVYGVTHFENFASQRIMQKIGMRERRVDRFWERERFFYEIGRWAYQPREGRFVILA